MISFSYKLFSILTLRRLQAVGSPISLKIIENDSNIRSANCSTAANYGCGNISNTCPLSVSFRLSAWIIQEQFWIIFVSTASVSHWESVLRQPCWKKLKLELNWKRWKKNLLKELELQFSSARWSWPLWLWHSTEVAFKHLTQRPRVRILALPWFFSSQYCLVHGRYWEIQPI